MTIEKFQKSRATDENKVRKTLAKAFWNLASHYRLTQKEQSILLGIRENRARLNKYKDECELPDDPDKVFRVATLVGIHKNLRILFPHNREVVYKWLKTKRELFNGISAMDYIAEDPMISLKRLVSVRRLLDQLRVGA
ncbi:MAG: DUF2384 domain-containing protein [Oligoflexales bacterium]|nr:DUF2384 domain-containing protein [Oligoflexales bacterium]